jgi:hypothetical protein
MTVWESCRFLVLRNNANKEKIMSSRSAVYVLCLSAVIAIGTGAQPGLQAAEPNPELAELTARFYEPSEKEAKTIGGMSRAAFEARAKRTERFLKQLAAIDRAALATSDRIDYDYLHAQLDNSLQSLRDIKIWQKRPGDYVPFDSYFAASLDEAVPWEDRYPLMVEALTADLGNFDHAKENLHGPPPLWIERAVTLVDNTLRYLDTEMLDIIARAPDEAMARKMEQAATAYRLKLVDYREFLVEDLRPGDISDLAVGETEYLRLLRNHFLFYSVDEMVTIGTKLYKETEELMQQTAATIDPNKSWRQLIEENRMDHRAPWELFPDLTKEAARAKKIVYDEVINVPDDVSEEYRYVQHAHPVTIPRGASGIGPYGFRHGDSYVGYYSLPSIDQYDDPQRQSEFMMDWSRAWYIAQQIPHEVYPGHHFAVFMYDKNERPVRRLVGSAPYTDVSSTMSEGWAVYVEELMYDHGYLNDEPRLFLGHLQHRLWRIARIILDPQFHTGRIDYEYMVDFFEGTGTSRGQAHVEATQITNIPAHDVGYYMGVVEIKALIEEYKAIVGAENFDSKEFNTTLMLAGNVPVALLRPEILEHARALARRN